MAFITVTSTHPATDPSYRYRLREQDEDSIDLNWLS